MHVTVHDFGIEVQKPGGGYVHRSCSKSHLEAGYVYPYWTDGHESIGLAKTPSARPSTRLAFPGRLVKSPSGTWRYDETPAEDVWTFDAATSSLRKNGVHFYRMPPMNRGYREDINIILCGGAGQPEWMPKSLCYSRDKVLVESAIKYVVYTLELVGTRVVGKADGTTLDQRVARPATYWLRPVSSGRVMVCDMPGPDTHATLTLRHKLEVA